MNSKRVYTANELGIDSSSISPGALFVCQTLQEAGFDGYLVGGCVRDWLLGKEPKDFDVVTNARPEKVKSIFKRSRVIGRRFKLVHVRYQRELLEVATYRADPGDNAGVKQHRTSDSGRLLADNVYGSLETDARRRDFTANALYYNPITKEVVDYLGGVQDCLAKDLKIIGDVDSRFKEDPVRMLRALRFVAKLGFNLSQKVDQLIYKDRHLLLDVSNARMFDETFKLFHHAHAIQSWQQLSDYGFLKLLFPEVYKILKQGEYPIEEFIHLAMTNTDKRVRQNKPVIPAYFFAVLLWYPYQAKRASKPNLPKGREGVYLVADKVIKQQYPIIAIPRRVSVVMTEIWDMQWFFEQRRAKSIRRILDERRFRAAYDFLLLRHKVGEVETELVDWWTEIQELNPDQQAQMINKLRGQAPGKNSRGRRRRRKKPSPKKHGD